MWSIWFALHWFVTWFVGYVVCWWFLFFIFGWLLIWHTYIFFLVCTFVVDLFLFVCWKLKCSLGHFFRGFLPLDRKRQSWKPLDNLRFDCCNSFFLLCFLVTYSRRIFCIWSTVINCFKSRDWIGVGFLMQFCRPRFYRPADSKSLGVQTEFKDSPQLSLSSIVCKVLFYPCVVNSRSMDARFWWFQSDFAQPWRFRLQVAGRRWWFFWDGFQTSCCFSDTSICCRLGRWKHFAGHCFLQTSWWNVNVGNSAFTQNFSTEWTRLAHPNCSSIVFAVGYVFEFPNCYLAFPPRLICLAM